MGSGRQRHADKGAQIEHGTRCVQQQQNIRKPATKPTLDGNSQKAGLEVVHGDDAACDTIVVSVGLFGLVAAEEERVWSAMQVSARQVGQGTGPPTSSLCIHPPSPPFLPEEQAS